MSADAIARWNAIPMQRAEVDSGGQAMKRTRDDMDTGDSDDDISLVSRTPSPPPEHDKMDIDKYDEYTRGVEREVITVDTKINSNNKGFALLAKLGWVEGQPLGLSGDGRVEPVPFVLKNDFTGLGKTNQDVRMIESTVSQRRELDSERMTRETGEQRKAREESVAKRNAVQSEISSVLRPFYCELCEKQFKNVAQYDEHTNSYAHHHKARFRDMQAAQRINLVDDLDARKEKERKREEKELRKLAKAAGIKMPKPATPASAPAPEISTPLDPSSQEDSKPSGSKKGGWATVGPSAFAPVPPVSSPASSASIGSTQQRGGWASVSQPPPPPLSSSTPSGPAPAFRTGGWTSLDTGSTVGPVSPPVPAPPPPSQAPPSPAPSRSTWATVSAPTQSPIPSKVVGGSGWQGTTNPVLPRPPIPISASQTGDNSVPAVQPAGEPRQPPATKRVEAARSGWQQFKAGGPRRR